MIHMKMTCDKRRTKKDGTHPIVFRITLNGISRDLASGFSCKAREWDFINRVIRAKTDINIVVAKRLKDKELFLLSEIRNFEEKYPTCKSVQEVKNYLSNNKEIPLTVLEFWETEIKRLNKAGKYGNSRNYQSALSGLLRVTTLKISFEELDYQWLVKVETKLRARNLMTNSISIYFRKLRSIYNRAINYGVADYSSYPFRRYKIKSEASLPRTLTLIELKRYFSFDAKGDEKLQLAWDVGRLIFLLRGINFTDLAQLSESNIKGGRLMYKRVKTQKLYSVKLLPIVEEIFNFYKRDESDLLLPFLTNIPKMPGIDLLNVLRQKRKTTNKWLRKLGESLEIDESLSTYVFRYSHANACKSLGYSKDLISESLGHGYGLAVSSAYLENYNIELVDEMNQVVCGKILGVK